MLGSSWFTKLSAIVIGLIGILLGFPAFTGAITAWSNHTAVDWRSVLTATGFVVVTAGLAAAKQFNVHGGTVDTGVRPAEVPITIAPPLPGAVPMPAAAINPSIPRSPSPKREDLP